MNVAAQAVGMVVLFCLWVRVTNKSRAIATSEAVAFVVSAAWKALVGEDMTEEETLLESGTLQVSVSPHARDCTTDGVAFSSVLRERQHNQVEGR